MATYIDLFKPFQKQKEILEHPARFKHIRAGRRAGKTECLLNELVYQALTNPGENYWYVAPLYKQAKEIAWVRLMEIISRLPKSLVSRKPNESELTAWLGRWKREKDGTLSTPAKISMKGAEDPNSLRGSGLKGIILDEYPFMKPNLWEEILRPAVADKLGWVWFVGTPQGYNHFYDLENFAKAHESDGWKTFHYTTYDNPHISRAEIDQMKRDMSSDKFQQEVMAEYTRFTGAIYKDFSRDHHVIQPFQIPESWYKFRTIDFGFSDPFVCLWVAVDYDDNIYIYKEYYRRHETTDSVARAIHELTGDDNIKITYGDSENAQGIKDLTKAGIPVSPAYKAKGSVIGGIEKVSDRLRINPFTRKPKLFVFSNCVNTIKEFEQYRWKEEKSPEEKEGGYYYEYKQIPHHHHSHTMDAIRYFILTYYRPRRKRKTKRIIKNPYDYA